MEVRELCNTNNHPAGDAIELFDDSLQLFQIKVKVIKGFTDILNIAL